MQLADADFFAGNSLKSYGRCEGRCQHCPVTRPYITLGVTGVILLSAVLLLKLTGLPANLGPA